MISIFVDRVIDDSEVLFMIVLKGEMAVMGSCS